MTRILTTTAVLALLAAAPAWAQIGGTPNQQDRDFVNEAAIGGKYEVDLGKAAEGKAGNQAVKDFGKRMVDDHTKANDKLATVAKDLQLTVPTALDQKHKDIQDRLAKLSSEQFDHDYMAEMVKDHQEDAALLEKEIGSGANAQVKSFASETLPTIQEHLKLAQDTQAKLGPPLTSSTPGTSSSGASGTAPGTSQPGIGR